MSTGVEVVYIDGFAGKGKFDDGTPGSPLLVKEKVYQAKANSKFNTKITPYFVEYEHADILRSNLLPIELAKYSHNNEYGITIVSLDEEFRQKFEPNTAKYEERIASLKALHDAGFYTWVSIEPYPTPNMIDQSLEEILKAVSFADKIIFGRLHYNKEVSAYKKHKEFFNEQAKHVIEFCEQNKKAYHIKNGTITE